MHCGRHTIALAVAFLMCTACAMLPEPASNVPPSRLSQYLGPRDLGPHVTKETQAEERLPDGPIRAGLVFLADTTAPGAAPVFGDEALEQMAESLRAQLGKALRINIEQTLPADGIRPGGDLAQFVALGKKYQVDYLLIAVASSTEQEYPFTVFLGWTSHSQPGLRRDNWSLVETALLDVNRGLVVLRAEGRGWATLDRPTAAGINQWYPVIWKRPQEPNWRWWPPTYESAPHTLRVIAMQDAVKRMVLNMQDAWIQKRQQELDKMG